MFGNNPLMQLLMPQAPAEKNRTVESPVDLIKNLASFAGFMGGRSTETEEGRNIEMGDPGTSDFADMLTGASGLQDLLQGNVTGGNLMDAAGVAMDAGIPGPPIMPALGALLPTERVMNFMRRGVLETSPLVRGASPEDLLSGISEGVLKARGGPADHAAAAGHGAVEAALGVDPEWAIQRYGPILEAASKNSGLNHLIFPTAAGDVLEGRRSLASFSDLTNYPKGTLAKGADFFSPGAIDPGGSKVRLGVTPPATFGPQHDALAFSAGERLPEVAGHELVHGAFTQLPPTQVRSLMADEGSINNLIRNIDEKQGGIGTSYYAGRGLPAIVNEGVASAFPHIDRLPEMLRDDFGPLFAFLIENLGITP